MAWCIEAAGVFEELVACSCTELACKSEGMVSVRFYANSITFIQVLGFRLCWKLFKVHNLLCNLFVCMII